MNVGLDLVHGGGHDAFVAKVKSGGSTLVYAGFIGGAGEDSGSSIAVDAAGNAYVGSGLAVAVDGDGDS